MAITVSPLPVAANKTITINWTVVSDSNRYQLVVGQQQAGGDSSTIYDGPERECTFTIPVSYTSIWISLWAYSPTYGWRRDYFTWEDSVPGKKLPPNTAPGTPSSISVSPNPPVRTQSVTVSCGTATDAEGNLTGYIFERQYNGGSWALMQKSSSRNFTETIQSGWTTVAYRVKAYDSDGLESSYRTSSTYTTAAANTAPTTPGTPSISPNPPLTGQAVTASWTASTDTDGNLSGYSLERQFNDGSWAVVQANANRTFTETVQGSWETVRYRVRAYDTNNAYSSYATGSTYTISIPPVISGSNSNLGTKTEGFAVNYTVTHPQSKTTTVTEKVDNTVLRTYTATLGQQQTLNLTGMAFMMVLNGSHTLTITATDNSGITVTRTYTFAKSVTKAVISLVDPLPADDMPTVCILNVTRSIPEGADFTVEVCNNGYDAAPAWEDCTAKVLSGNKIFFNNTTKTAAEWGLNFRVTADRNDATGEGNISSIGGNFNGGDDGGGGSAPKALTDYTWEQIASISASGNAPSYWDVGDTKDIELTTGEILTLKIYDFDHDDLTAGGKAGITFGLKDLMNATRRMEATNTNANGYDGSEMRAWLVGDLHNSLPDDLRNLITPVNKKTSAGNLSTTIVTTSEAVFLFSPIEVFGTAGSYSVDGEGNQYSGFFKAADRIKFLSNGDGATNSWLTRSPNKDNSTNFTSVGTGGTSSSFGANVSSGVCFGFCI